MSTSEIGYLFNIKYRKIIAMGELWTKSLGVKLFCYL